jgi:hypothetical protein
MWYTKRLLVCPYFCSGLARTLSYSDPPSTLQSMDPSSGIDFIPVVELPAEPLPLFETFFVVVDTLSVVVVN